MHLIDSICELSLNIFNNNYFLIIETLHIVYYIGPIGDRVGGNHNVVVLLVDVMDNYQIRA